MPELAYFDSCIFVELLQQKNQERFDACEQLRKSAQDKILIIVTSALTITEVNKLPETTALREEQSKTILAFFENPYIALRSVDRQVAEKAHELTRTHSLANNDAIHVATAILYKVPVLYTYDSKKQRRKGLLIHNLKIGNPPLRIEVPPEPVIGPLFEKKNRVPQDDDPAKTEK
jgi:predicted nucleic acid-binding protein